MHQPTLPLATEAMTPPPDPQLEQTSIPPAALWSTLTAAQQQLLTHTLTDICRQLVADALVARSQEVRDELT
jgi:hypothetical protein